MHIEVNDDDRSRVWYPLSLSLNNCERWRSDFDGPDIVMNLPSGVARDTLVQSWVRTRSRKTSLQDEFPRVVKNTPGSPSFGCCLDSCSEGRVSHERESLQLTLGKSVCLTTSRKRKILPSSWELSSNRVPKQSVFEVSGASDTRRVSDWKWKGWSCRWKSHGSSDRRWYRLLETFRLSDRKSQEIILQTVLLQMAFYG